MKSLQQILKANGQSPNQAYQTGKFKLDKTAGCLIYSPPEVIISVKVNKEHPDVKGE